MFHTITLNEFHQAIANGDYPLVKQYILHHDGNYAAINAKLGNDIPPIALAIIKEQAQIAKFLLNNGVDVNAAASGKGVTPLFLACAKGNLDVVRALLVVSGIVINTIHFSGYNPLEAAALQGHAQIVLALLAAGAYIQDYDIFIPALQERGHEEIAEIIRLHREERLNYLKQMAPLDVRISDADKVCIEKISPRNLDRLRAKITCLQQMNKLTRETFSWALNQVTYKLASIPELTIVVKQKKYPRTAIGLSDGTHLYVDRHASRQRELARGQGLVHRGYTGATGTDPAYCVKRFYMKGTFEVANPLLMQRNLAMREAEVLALLNRKAVWYMSKRGPVLLTQWMPDASLDLITIDFRTLSFLRRFKMLASLLPDIKLMHDHGIAHRDIKPANIMLHLERDFMAIIDFASAQPTDSPEEGDCDYKFIDPNECSPKKLSGDLYMLGIPVAFIFQELYRLEDRSAPQVIAIVNQEKVTAVMLKTHVIKLKSVDLTPIECAVVSLVDALMETIPEHRCSIQQVLNFCMAMTNSIDVNDQIDAATLQDILSRTLNRKEFLAEDSRYDAMRPAKFTNNVLLQENSQEGGRQIGVKAMISPVSTFKQASPKKPKPVAKLNAKENELTFKF